MAQTILVTGSNSGFGRLTVETLARQGYTVFAGMRAVASKNAPAATELRALAEKHQLALRIVEIDITNDASVEQAITTTIAATGRLDVVVNNAGIVFEGPLEAFTIDQAQQQFDTNIFGALRVNRAALPQMRRQGSGLLLQIGSVAGRLALPFFGLYGATKFALESITESYRYELAPFGIDAAIIEPGTYPTPINAKSQAAADGERATLYKTASDTFMTPFFQELNTATPPNPQDVADAVARIIAQPAGERPLHTVVAPVSQGQAAEAINTTTTHVTHDYLAMLDVIPLVTLNATGMQ